MEWTCEETTEEQAEEPEPEVEEEQPKIDIETETKAQQLKAIKGKRRTRFASRARVDTHWTGKKKEGATGVYVSQCGSLKILVILCQVVSTTLLKERSRVPAGQHRKLWHPQKPC